MVHTTAWSARDVFANGPPDQNDVPVYLLKNGELPDGKALTDGQRAWLATQKFNGAAKKQVQLPAADGSLAGVAFGLGDGALGEPSGPSELLCGLLPQSLAARTYRLAEASTQVGTPRPSELAAIAWGLGAYKFGRYRSAGDTTRPSAEPSRARLRLSDAKSPTLSSIQRKRSGLVAI